MKYENYEQKLTDLVKSNPDSAVAVQDILAELKTDSEAFASLEASVAEKDGKIRDLQDSNLKLFLRQTGEPEQEPEEKSIDEQIDELFKEE